jgi:hypothetical protein
MPDVLRLASFVLEDNCQSADDLSLCRGLVEFGQCLERCWLARRRQSITNSMHGQAGFRCSGFLRRRANNGQAQGGTVARLMTMTVREPHTNLLGRGGDLAGRRGSQGQPLLRRIAALQALMEVKATSRSRRRDLGGASRRGEAT